MICIKHVNALRLAFPEIIENKRGNYGCNEKNSFALVAAAIQCTINAKIGEH